MHRMKDLKIDKIPEAWEEGIHFQAKRMSKYRCGLVGSNGVAKYAE